ncbi:tRNA (N(6)-L-threonylcarbamoyladenosine(37)-C(2))-methylthiotransferase MtaB [bacterium F11]|nr:tRNA (N(6)-L-threonylcarbamoyladenosine(37)-C(2))-methylthiotransferase MtaB [bacterium F11]
MKIWSFTFGCKVNQYETELLRHRLLGSDDSSVSHPQEADLCLINTCTVTAFADKECRQLIRRITRINPMARLIVTGCYATRAREEIQNLSPQVEVYTNEEKDDLPSCLGFEVSEKPLGIHQFAGRTRAFLKIQDGCQAPCSYCIIPTIRPNMVSKPVERVISEIQALLKNGYREIVLTGIRLGLYRGLDTSGNKHNLIQLLKKVVTLEGQFRVRLSSLEVTEVTDSLIDFVAAHSKICRHLHIPLQSGDSQVLKDMKRWYGANIYRDRVKTLRQTIPDCGVTADVMVGYPTETDLMFENTSELIKEVGLSGLHVFRYSARTGTKASILKPLDPKVIAHRAQMLGTLDQQLRGDFYERFRGHLREVLPEPLGEGWSDNYIRVDVPKSKRHLDLSHMPIWSSYWEGKRSQGIPQIV